MSDKRLLAGGLIIGGGILLYIFLKGRPVPFCILAPLLPGENLAALTSPALAGSGQLRLSRGTPIVVTMPSVRYMGSGRDAYSYFRVVQQQNGIWVTIYGSGIAGTHLGPATTWQTYALVPPDVPQPPGCPSQSLCTFAWPGPEPTPICGAPPQSGVATGLLEIYERRTPADADGYSSPTCNPRVPVACQVYPDKFLFY